MLQHFKRKSFFIKAANGWDEKAYECIIGDITGHWTECRRMWIDTSWESLVWTTVNPSRIDRWQVEAT